jgi:hypothetical protein
MTTPVVGVSPPAAIAGRRRLFSALSRALDVQFVDAQTVDSPLLASVYLGEEPTIVTESSLVMGIGHGTTVDRSRVRFASADAVDGTLRGWEISDETLRGARGITPGRTSSTLAEAGDVPVWTTRTSNAFRLDHAALAPEELGPEETLRSRLVPGRFFGLLPLVSFIRSLDRPDQWHRPPVRASFMVDDPNLHSVNYGYIDFRKIAGDAADIGFHVSIATIPLDGWLISSKAAKIFKTHSDQLSLLFHGNNHTKHELGYTDGPVPGLQMLAQGIRRIRRFEKRSGIPVAQVMAAPHGRCSEEAAWDMARLGFESMCVTRSFPWLDRPPSGFPLAGWFPADTSSVMPAIVRVPLSSNPEEIVLRAFLGQPIMLYGHDSDLGAQPDLFATWAEQVARLDGVAWLSAGEISRELVSWRSDGETLWVRPHTRFVNVATPPGIGRLIVEADGEGYETAVVTDGVDVVSARPLSSGDSGEIALSGTGGDLTIRLRPNSAVNCDDLAVPRWSPWPLTRRILTEARDRSRPKVSAWRNR